MSGTIHFERWGLTLRSRYVTAVLKRQTDWTPEDVCNVDALVLASGVVLCISENWASRVQYGDPIDPAQATDMRWMGQADLFQQLKDIGVLSKTSNKKQMNRTLGWMVRTHLLRRRMNIPLSSPEFTLVEKADRTLGNMGLDQCEGHPPLYQVIRRYQEPVDPLGVSLQVSTTLTLADVPPNRDAKRDTDDLSESGSAASSEVDVVRHRTQTSAEPAILDRLLGSWGHIPARAVNDENGSCSSAPDHSASCEQVRRGGHTRVLSKPRGAWTVSCRAWMVADATRGGHALSRSEIDLASLYIAGRIVALAPQVVAWVMHHLECTDAFDMCDAFDASTEQFKVKTVGDVAQMWMDHHIAVFGLQYSTTVAWPHLDRLHWRVTPLNETGGISSSAHAFSKCVDAGEGDCLVSAYLLSEGQHYMMSEVAAMGPAALEFCPLDVRTVIKAKLLR